MAPSRFPRTPAVLLAAALAATSSAIDFSGQNEVTQTAGTVAPGGETPTTSADTGANGFGNFDSPMQWEASSSNNVPTTAPMIAPSGIGGWSQPTTTDTPSVYSAGSGQTSGGSGQTWSQPTTPETPSVWIPTSGQGSGTGDQGWPPASSNVGPPSTGDSSGY
ncbi:hypothetical protein PC128_g26766, partial [Phytophthora cactorum]